MTNDEFLTALEDLLKTFDGDVITRPIMLGEMVTLVDNITAWVKSKPAPGPDVNMKLENVSEDPDDHKLDAIGAVDAHYDTTKPGLDSPPYAGGAREPKRADKDMEHPLTAPMGDIFGDVALELGRAKAKFPDWPFDPIHAMGVVHEEIGEMAKDVLQIVYEPDKEKAPSDLRAEAIQSMAMLTRFVMALDSSFYEWNSRRQGRD